MHGLDDTVAQGVLSVDCDLTPVFKQTDDPPVCCPRRLDARRGTNLGEQFRAAFRYASLTLRRIYGEWAYECSSP